LFSPARRSYGRRCGVTARCRRLPPNKTQVHAAMHSRMREGSVIAMT
jgi:hypothetical protein